MSEPRHHAILVTSWDGPALALARQHAIDTAPTSMGGEPFARLVSDVALGVINAVSTFLIAPDGSYEGWEDSDIGDQWRDQIVVWLEAQAYEDGSNRFVWVEVQYGDGQSGDTRVIRDSDAYARLSSET